jgi:signal transduction histidine kinase
MRERVASLDGCFSAVPADGSFTVRAEIPRGAAA